MLTTHLDFIMDHSEYFFFYKTATLHKPADKISRYIATRLTLGLSLAKYGFKSLERQHTGFKMARFPGNYNFFQASWKQKKH